MQSFAARQTLQKLRVPINAVGAKKDSVESMSSRQRFDFTGCAGPRDFSSTRIDRLGGAWLLFGRGAGCEARCAHRLINSKDVAVAGDAEARVLFEEAVRQGGADQVALRR
eukprot:6213096-Pleurochrysis_carterae.AAC.2